ncbi:S8 family serine peptidase [Alteribacter natronophilus]|uniref:S8 family serine peptidase n=1 Tax=Alteribacter natronophilus TaxID=2583810 RepID=UPI00110D8D39|nr:S8 family serine peptidase [Alteribacter natronophilus]TMW72872.1 nisin leader peptide-processing serine protease NisP [Alteribacter natronophilus]
MKRSLKLTGTAALAAMLLVPSLGFSSPGDGDLKVTSDGEEKRFVVTFKSESLPADVEQMILEAGGEVTYEIGEIGVLEASTEEPLDFLKAITSEGDVLGVSPSMEVTLDLPEFDFDIDEGFAGGDNPGVLDPDESIWESGWQWDIEKTTQNGASHDVHSGTHDVVVGVIDTGFDFDHPDLKDNIIGGPEGSRTFVPGTEDSWDNQSHGTHVAGTIAGNGRMKGVAPDAGLKSYRVFNTGGAQQIWITDAIIAAADDGVDVINMSLGGTRVKGQWFYTDPATGERVRLGNNQAADVVAYKRAIDYAVERNVTVVSSAGNSAQDMSNPRKVAEWIEGNAGPEYDVRGAAWFVPASIPGVITVSAMGGGFDTDDRLAFYSNYGNGAIDIGAPGGDLGPEGYDAADDFKFLVLSTVPTYMDGQSARGKDVFGENGYGWKGGTSMAAPQVSGAAAAYISQVYEETGKKPTPRQVQNRLQQSAERVDTPGYSRHYGHGRVNAYQALTR